MRIRIFWCQPAGVMDYRLPFFEKMQRAFDVTFLFHQRGPLNHKLNCTYSSSISRIMIKQIGLSILGPADFRTMYSSIQRCNVFVSSFIWNSYTLVGLVLCKLFRKKVVVWEEANVVFPGFTFKILYTLTRLLCRSIDAFFVLGEPQKNYLMKFGVGAERVFAANEYPGHIYSEVHSRKIALPFEENASIIMYMGRFVEFKGVEYLIRAFAKVEKQRDDAALLIVGYGPLKEHLKAVARGLGIKSIHFAGDVGDINVRAYLLRRSSMVVVPSIIAKVSPRHEGGPMVVLEALSAGKPVISTDVAPHCLAFVKDGVNGYRVPQRNVDGLADRIMRLLDVPITPAQVLSTFREIKGYDYQAEQFQKAVNYSLRRKAS